MSDDEFVTPRPRQDQEQEEAPEAPAPRKKDEAKKDGAPST